MNAKPHTSIPEALRRYGWEATEHFWKQYYSDPWLFNVTNALVCAVEEADRLRGLALCMDQVCSGQKRWQTHEFTRHAESLGCGLVDMMHVGGTSDQPTSTPCKRCEGTGWIVWATTDGMLRVGGTCPKCNGEGRTLRTQKHAQGDFSTLLILRKGK